MSKSVTIDIASLPKDAEVEVHGLGVFKNGSTTEIPDERLTEYEEAGFTVPDGDFEIKVELGTGEPTELSEAEQALGKAVTDSDNAIQAQVDAQQAKIAAERGDETEAK